MNERSYGPTKFSEVSYLRYAHYNTGDDQHERIALLGFNERGEQNHVCTVNFPESPVNVGHVWIKNWSENEGVLQALIKAKIGTATGRTMRAGHVHAHELKLSRSVYKAAKDYISRFYEEPAIRGKKSSTA